MYTVRSDVFPAVLAVSPPDAQAPASIYTQLHVLEAQGGRRLERVRVIATGTHVVVFQDAGRAQGPIVIFNELIQDFTPAKTRSVRIRTLSDDPFPQFAATTESGKTLAWYRSGGCGCGSRLKGFNPFNTLSALEATAV